MSEQKPRTKQQILDNLEQQTLLIAGELAMAKIGYFPNMTQMENCLGEIIKDTLELKQLEGIPSSLSIVENLQEQA